jgi:Gliding motility associated protein GldN
MKLDSVLVQDPNTGLYQTKGIQPSRNSEGFVKMEIMQDWYFDFQREVLTPRIKWIAVMDNILNPDGSIRGAVPWCKIYYE